MSLSNEITLAIPREKTKMEITTAICEILTVQ